MDSQEKTAPRVTCKRKYLLNEFLLNFLSEFYEIERCRNDGSTMKFTFKNAVASLKKYPLEISELAELKNLKFFGNVVIRKLERRLAEYTKLHGQLTWDLLAKVHTTKSNVKKVRSKTTQSDQIEPLVTVNKSRRKLSTDSKKIAHSVSADKARQQKSIEPKFIDSHLSASFSNDFYESTEIPTFGTERNPLYANFGDTPTPSFSGQNSQTNDCRKKPKFVLEPARFDVILLVDHAEINERSMGSENKKKSMLQHLSEKNVKFETRKLNAGDYLWIARSSEQSFGNKEENEMVLDVVIERKRMDDLASSIKDGRWHSQKYRLKKCGLSNVIYLFEQMPKNGKMSAIDPQALESAIINTEVQDGFIVHRSGNLKETVDYLEKMTEFLTKAYALKRLVGVEERTSNHKNFYKDDSTLSVSTVELVVLADFQKMAERPRNFRIGEMSVMCLMQIPGLSFETAKFIVKTYGALTVIREKIQGAPQQILLDLQELKLGTPQGRRLGPALAKKIIDFFQ